MRRTLLLLLFLSVDQLRLLVFFEKLRPFFVGGELFVGRKNCLRRSYADADLQLGFGFSFHHAHGGRNVGVVAAYGGADVTLPGETVGCGIKP